MSGGREHLEDEAGLLDSLQSLKEWRVDYRDLMTGEELIPEERIVYDLWSPRDAGLKVPEEPLYEIIDASLETVTYPLRGYHP